MTEAKSENDAHDDRLDLSSARHGAAHAVAALHLGATFGSVVPTADGGCELVGPIWSDDRLVTARVSMAGACLDMEIDLLEDDGDPNVTEIHWLETWRDDVERGEGGYRDDIVATNGLIAQAAPWALAFVRANAELIDEVAAIMIDAGAAGVDFDVLAARFGGLATEPNQDELDTADLTFTGAARSFDLIDDAVASYLAERRA